MTITPIDLFFNIIWNNKWSYKYLSAILLGGKEKSTLSSLLLVPGELFAYVHKRIYQIALNNRYDSLPGFFWSVSDNLYKYWFI